MAAIQLNHEELGLHQLFWAHSVPPTTVGLISYLCELSNLHCRGVAPWRAASWGSPPPVSGSPAPLPAAPSSDPAEEASPLDSNAAQFRTMYWMCRGGLIRTQCVTSQIVGKPILAQYLAYTHVVKAVAITEDTEVLRSCFISGGIWDLDRVCILHWRVVYRLISVSFFSDTIHWNWLV